MPGEYVIVHGRSSTRSYEKADGSKGYATETVASSIETPGALAETRTGSVIEVPDIPGMKSNTEPLDTSDLGF